MSHHHHDHPHGHHPPDTRVQSQPSFLRLSARERLLGAAMIIAVLWGAILWAMR